MAAKHALIAGFCLALAAPAAAQALAPPGAAACSGCHAPAQLGTPVAPILGVAAKDVVQAMQEFRTGARAATVMDRIAKGFTEAETQAIAAWLAAQR